MIFNRKFKYYLQINLYLKKQCLPENVNQLLSIEI